MSKRDEYLFLRGLGMTYEAIAKVYGCSRQNVQQACKRGKRKGIKPEMCVYEGLRNWMNENRLNLVGLYRRMYDESTTFPSAYVFRTRMNGKSRWRLDEINRMLDITGLTYEQLFREEVVHDRMAE